LKAIEDFILVQDRNSIASLLEFLGSFNDVKYTIESIEKVLTRVKEVNFEFTSSSDIRDVKIKFAIRQGKINLIDEIDMSFEMAKEFETKITPSYTEIEKIKNRKTRTFEANLRSWFKKNT